MKKLCSVIISLMLGIVALFGIAGCNSGTQSELQGKIDELQSRIEELEDKLAQLESAKISVGKFVKVQEAFESKEITKDDLAHIVYFMTGKVYEIDEGKAYDNRENWINVNFEPKVTLSELNKKVEFDIRLSFYAQFYTEYFREVQKVSEAINKLKIEYLGKYNANYAVRITGIGGYGAVVYPVSLGGLVWEQEAPDILIFSYK